MYGVRRMLQLVDHGQLHALRQLLPDLLPLRDSALVQEYEVTVHCAFCGDALLHGRHTSLDRLHALEVREDVFVRGPSEKPAVLIHCQHVLNGLLRLHKKTPHLLAAVVMGSAVWTAKELLFDKQLVSTSSRRR